MGSTPALMMIDFFDAVPRNMFCKKQEPTDLCVFFIEKFYLLININKSCICLHRCILYGYYIHYILQEILSLKTNK